jgi:hypothetical protein
VHRSQWLALALAAPLLVACAGDRAAPKPGRAYTLDEIQASFRGFALGDAERRVVARFGSDQGKPDGPVGPVHEDHYEAGTPGTFASTPGHPRPDDRTKSLRYRGMAFVTNRRRVYVIMSTLPGTRTRRRVGVGDDLDRARRAYSGLSCKHASDADGGDVFPYCLGRLDRKRYLYFGGDPIGSVAIAQVPLYGS